MKLKEKEYALQKMIMAAYFKIFLNYGQTVAIFANLNLKWNENLFNVFQAFRTTSGNWQEIITLDCLFDGKILLFKIIP